MEGQGLCTGGGGGTIPGTLLYVSFSLYNLIFLSTYDG